MDNNALEHVDEAWRDRELYFFRDEEGDVYNGRGDAFDRASPLRNLIAADDAEQYNATGEELSARLRKQFASLFRAGSDYVILRRPEGPSEAAHFHDWTPEARHQSPMQP